MTGEDMTPLTAVRGLTPGRREELASRWIQSAEDYLACEIAEHAALSAEDEAFASSVSADTRQSLLSYRPVDYGLGLAVPESDVANMMAARVCRAKAGTPFSVAASAESKGDLPPEVRLTDRMPPIRDQHKRGTCTAFASVSLCEYVEKNKVRLSPQFLYWACKQRDGQPHSDGTSLATVEEALFEVGVCPDEQWTYCPNVKFVGPNRVFDAGQGPAPKGTEAAAKLHRRRCRSITPGAVGKYRELLAAGQPVVVGLLVFTSWIRNPLTAQTGKVFLPSARVNDRGETVIEKPAGGHAMCLVGYVDDDEAPGGGYFIVRNSWGTAWAPKCPEGAGHALMPYDYVGAYTCSAFTVCEDDLSDPCAGERALSLGKTPHAAEPQPGLAVFETLAADSRDVNGLQLTAGTPVVRVGHVLVKQAGGNFGAKPYLEALRQQVFRAGVPPEILAWRSGYLSKIGDNLSINSMKMSLFPERASWNAFRIVNGRRIWRSRKVADFTDTLRDAALADMLNGVRDLDLPTHLAGVVGMEPPEAWKTQAGQSFAGKVYEIGGFFPGRRAYAVEAFVTRWAFDPVRGFAPAAATSCEIQRVIESAEAAVPQLARTKNLVFYAIGTGLPSGKKYDGSLSGNRVVTVSAPSPDGTKWIVRVAPNLTKRMPFRDFCDRLMPVTQDDLVSAVKDRVDGTIRAGVTGRMLYVEDLVRELQAAGAYSAFPPFRRTAVKRALLQLQGHDPSAFALCRMTRPVPGVAVMAPGDVQPEDRPFRSRSRKVNFLIHHALRLTAGVLCMGLLVVKDMYLKTASWWAVFPILIGIWLVGSWAQDKIVELSEIEKE